MGCTPSMLLDHKKGHRDSTESQDQVLAGKGNKDGGSRGNNGRNSSEPNVAKTAPRASMDSDGFSIQLGPTQAPNSASSTNNKKDSYVSQMGNNYTTSLHIKRISGGSGGSPSARLGHRKSSLALTPEDEPLDITNRNTPGGMTGGIVVPHVENLRVMMVMFPERGDRVSDAIAEACSRLGLDSSSARSDEATEMCTNYRPALVLVDCRTNRLDGENVCRALRNLKFTQFTVIVAVVKKSHYVKEDFSILPYLDAGFNRVIVESTHASAWFRELSQLTRGLARPLAQAGAARALLAALQRVKDAVHITDEHCRIQYANRAGERLCGSGVLEVGADALSQLGRGKEWEGALPGRRRIGGGAEMPSPTCHAVPVSCDGRSTTHFVFVSESSPPLFPTPAWETARGSMHSVRRASLDVRSIGSEGMRRASLVKLQGLPLEAPITKVIALLSSAQEGATPQTVMLIDKAVDVLRNTELYSPHLRTDDHRLRPDDPVANDLIGALLSQGPTNVLSSRRSSNDSTVIRSQASRQNTKHYAPVQIRDLLDTSLAWDFDIFRLEELTKRRPLVHLGINLMIHFDACSVLDCDEKTVLNWLTIIEMNYHVSNTYHNSTHAADVMQAVACYLQRDRLQSLLEPLDEVCALIAAAAHDVDHPGTSSAFLCNSRHPLAVLYNDLAVLESHHAALMFKLTINDDRVNIFKNLDRESYKTARHTVIDMILATEMTRHFEHLAKFVNVFCSKPNSGSKEDGMTLDEVPVIDVTTLSLPENIVLIKRMMIKCADVSNPSRSAKYCIEWARRIAEEYFLQTDEEKARDLPVVMPVFDRASCSIPRSQIGFIDFIIIDMMEAWDAFIDMPEIVQHTRDNYKIWRDMDEQGVTTLQDVKKMQAKLVAPIIPKSRSSPE